MHIARQSHPCPCTTAARWSCCHLSPQFVIHHIDVEVQLSGVFRFERGSFQFHNYVCMELYVVQNQVGIEIAVANLEMFLPCDKGESVAHLQQITGNVLYQLFFYVPFVRTFFGSCQVEDIRVFNR